ncbi:carbonic anhydrase [Halomonas sp. M20]|uniref:carbonic anhydrase n=1 Tax=Halomonas sp. M20 TaxID=2763264 RepID=UPI001D0B6866|nr:carbonic anhydrase family protein [Halomonas sp. M20]
MKKALCLSAVLLASGAANAEGEAKWGYSGDKGPENWAALSPDNAICSGKNQSPINLTGFIEAELQPITFDYQKGGQEILNNGHTVQVNYASGSSIEVDGINFDLKQFHFHAPSENHIEGKSYPLEAHLVHASEEGDLAVVAVMFEEGEANEGLKQGWANMPEQAGDEHPLSEQASASALLPSDRDYYRFNGSLTTPPCTQGVRWLVMKQPLTASQEQIERFADVLHEPNNRSLQPVNARPVLQ